MTEKDKTTDALLSCPFCGTEATPIKDAAGNDLVYCIKPGCPCACITTWEKWNTRVSTPTPSSEPVPDGEIIEVIEDMAEDWAMQTYDSDEEQFAYAEGFKDAISALRSHYNVTITRKE